MPSIFVDKSARPTDSDLAEALGRTKAHWDTIAEHVETSYDRITTTWIHYGKKYGWQLKFIIKKKVLLYLVPQKKSFIAVTAMPDRALPGLRDSALPPELIAEIEGSKKYPEGRIARVDVTAKKHVKTVERLVAVKYEVM